MSSLDHFAPNFKRAAVRWPGLSENHTEFVDSFDRGKEDVLVRANSYVQAVCKTVLSEAGKDIEENASHQKLLSCALSALDLSVHTATGEIREIINGHNKISDAVNNIRNHVDTVSHGRVSNFESTYKNQRRIVVVGTDAVLGLLLDAEAGFEPNLKTTSRPHSDFSGSNELVNRGLVNVGIFDDEKNGQSTLEIETLAGTYRFSLSEILWSLEREGYVAVLDEVSSSIDAQKEKGERT